MQKIDCFFLELYGRIQQRRDDLAVVFLCLTVIGNVSVMQHGIGGFEGEIAVILHAHEALHYGIEVDDSCKGPAVIMAIAEVVGYVHAFDLVSLCC